MKMKHKIIANLMGATVAACLLLAPQAHAAEGDGRWLLLSHCMPWGGISWVRRWL